MKCSARLTDLLLTIFVSGLAFAVYLSTLAVGAYPGEFSSILTQKLGLIPCFTAERPLWNLVADLILQLPGGGDPARRLNLLSAFWGAIAVGLQYRVVHDIIFLCIRYEDDEIARVHRVARLGGLGAALALAFCVPFWVVSTRSHWATFHTTLFLLIVNQFNRLLERESRWESVAFGLGCGLVTVEYPSLVIFIPLFAAGFLIAQWKRENLSRRQWLPPAAAAVVGLSLYPLAAWLFMGTEGHRLLGEHTFLITLWELLRAQWFVLVRSLPSVGWLAVLLVTAVPAALGLSMARRGLNDESDWALNLLHIVLTSLAIAVLLNLALAPWRLLGFQRLLVMPYVLLTALVGYLLAFWYRLPEGWWPHSSNRLVIGLRCGAGLLAAVLGLGLIVAAAVRNLAQADGRPSAMVRLVAAETVKSLEGRTWLVTDGLIDDAIALEGLRQRLPLKLIDVTAARKPLMRAYVASLFDDPRLRNLADLNLATLVHTWFQTDTNTLHEVAVMTSPDLWVAAGHLAQPHLTLFLGGGETNRAAVLAAMQEHREFWQRMESSPYLNGSRSVGPLEGQRRYLCQRVGMVANNFGVWLEDLGEATWAYEAYTHARVLDPGNVCALMNQYTLLQQGHAAADAGDVRAAMKELEQLMAQNRPSLLALVRTYGYVRSPKSLAHLGERWAQGGQPELAMAGLRRAMGLQPDGDHQHAKEVLAGLYLLQNRDIESEALYEEMLSKNPQQQVALLGLARVAAFRGQTERAKAYLDRAAKAGVPDLVMQLEYAAFYLSAGEIAEAKALLKELVLKEPNLVRAWSMIVAINIKEKDTAGLYESVRRVQSIKEGNALLLATATGYLAMLQEDLVGAVMAFEKALSLSPSSVQILEWLVRLDLLQGAGPAVERRLTQLLELDPGNAFGNYVRAGLQIGRKDYELARDSLERSLETRKSPEAHNDLAWLLMEGGAFAEAETHARAALALQPSLCPAWDTLGVLMVKTKRFDEARVAFTKALELQPDNVTVAMNLIELDLRQGRKQEAAQRLDNVALRVDDLSADEQTNYQKLRQEL